MRTDMHLIDHSMNQPRFGDSPKDLIGFYSRFEWEYLEKHHINRQASNGKIYTQFIFQHCEELKDDVATNKMLIGRAKKIQELYDGVVSQEDTQTKQALDYFKEKGMEVRILMGDDFNNPINFPNDPIFANWN